MERKPNEFGYAGMIKPDLSELDDKKLECVMKLRNARKAVPRIVETPSQVITFTEYKKNHKDLTAIKSMTVLGEPSVKHNVLQKKLLKCSQCDVHGWGIKVMQEHLEWAHGFAAPRYFKYEPITVHEDMLPLIKGARTRNAYICQYCGEMWWGSTPMRSHAQKCYTVAFEKKVIPTK